MPFAPALRNEIAKAQTIPGSFMAKILRRLVRAQLLHKDQVVSRRDLSEHVWDDRFDPMSHVIDVLIHRLRKKVDGIRPTKLLHTVPGAGYMLKSERSCSAMP